MATPISGAAQKYFSFGEDPSKTGLTVLAVVAWWTDTGRTDGR